MKNKGLLIIAIIIALIIIFVLARRGERNGEEALETPTAEETQEAPETETQVTPPAEDGSAAPTDTTLTDLEDDLMKLDLSGEDADLEAIELKDETATE